MSVDGPSDLHQCLLACRCLGLYSRQLQLGVRSAGIELQGRLHLNKPRAEQSTAKGSASTDLGLNQCKESRATRPTVRTAVNIECGPARQETQTARNFISVDALFEYTATHKLLHLRGAAEGLRAQKFTRPPAMVHGLDSAMNKCFFCACRSAAVSPHISMRSAAGWQGFTFMSGHARCRALHVGTDCVLILMLHSGCT